MLNQAWYPLINIHQKTQMVKQHSDRMRSERSIAMLCDTEAEQEQKKEHPNNGFV